MLFVTSMVGTSISFRFPPRIDDERVDQRWDGRKEEIEWTRVEIKNRMGPRWIDDIILM